jgi:hypothetical protein
VKSVQVDAILLLGEWLAEITLADANISNARVEDSKLNKLASQDSLTKKKLLSG